MTIREHLRAIAYGEQLAHEDELIDLFQKHAVTALKILDGSREMTEKTTSTNPGRGWQPESGALSRRFKVTNHKARVVLDD